VGGREDGANPPRRGERVVIPGGSTGQLAEQEAARGVSNFPDLPARWRAEIVESDFDFSVELPARHAGAVT
jgi:hypothetical protein